MRWMRDRDTRAARRWPRGMRRRAHDVEPAGALGAAGGGDSVTQVSRTLVRYDSSSASRGRAPARARTSHAALRASSVCIGGPGNGVDSVPLLSISTPSALTLPLTYTRA